MAKRKPPAPGDKRRWNLWWRYKLTPADVDEMLAKQGGRCAIMGEPIDARSCHIDHDRGCCPGVTSCGKCVRGLLCFVCNTRMSWLENHEFVYRSNVYRENYLNRRRAEGAGSTPVVAPIITTPDPR